MSGLTELAAPRPQSPRLTGSLGWDAAFVPFGARGFANSLTSLAEDDASSARTCTFSGFRGSEAAMMIRHELPSRDREGAIAESLRITETGKGVKHGETTQDRVCNNLLYSPVCWCGQCVRRRNSCPLPERCRLRPAPWHRRSAAENDTQWGVHYIPQPADIPGVLR